MNNTITELKREKKRRLSTEELAFKWSVKPDTIRRSLCIKGHWCGLRPKKLPNRLLAWDDTQLEKEVTLWKQ